MVSTQLESCIFNNNKHGHTHTYTLTYKTFTLVVGYFFCTICALYKTHYCNLFETANENRKKMSKIKTYNRHYESEIKRELQTLVHSNIIHMIK